MIPKIIHYIWLGNQDQPEGVLHCIDSWKKIMPDYQFVLWDEHRVDEIDSVFVQEAIAEKKWAFASDVIRLYALEKYGGIYLDTDVLVYRSFDSLLNQHAFIGRENSVHLQGRSTINYLTTCCFGAEKGNLFIKMVLGYYRDRRFVVSNNLLLPSELRLDMRLNSEIFCILAQTLGYNASILANEKQVCLNDILTIYPSSTFDSVKVTSETYAKHLALGSWRDKPRKKIKYTFKYKIQWRCVAVLEWIMDKLGYLIVEKR